MTAPNGPILFNSINGDDAAASGLGPATAQTGTGASITSASNVVTGITTTGVTAGDLLWVQSSTGRQFSIIASVDSGTQVTCDDNFDVTESGRTWAIGGKRATLDGSSQLFERIYSDGKTIKAVLETDQSISSTINGTGGYNVLVFMESDDPETRRVITTSDATTFLGGTLYLKNLEFKTTYGSGSRFCWANTNGNVQTAYIYAENCIFGDPTDKYETFGTQSSRGVGLTAKDCVFQNFTGILFNGMTAFRLQGCTIRNNESRIQYQAGTSGSQCQLVNCLAHDNAEGFFFRWGSDTIIKGNIFYNCSTTYPLFDAYKLDTDGIRYRWFQNNIIVNCPNGVSTTDRWLASGNAYYNSGWSGFTNEVSPITLTADPFVDAAGGDFNLNATNGGGAVLRSTSINLGS